MLSISKEERYIKVAVSGKLQHQDYAEKLIPMIEEAVAEHGELNLMFVAQDFHGWSLQAAWDDLRTAVKHQKAIKKIAVVGEKSWQEKLIKVASVFISGQAKYFTMEQQAEAAAWLNSDA